MKKITVIIFCLMALYTQAQNTFPATGNVGIGTDTPSSALHVRGDLTVESKIYGPGRLHVSGEEFLYILNRKGVVIGREWGGNGNLSVQGNVGIGIADPLGKLHIVDNHVNIRTSEGSSNGWSKNSLTVEGNPDSKYSTLKITSGHAAVGDRGLLNVDRQGNSYLYVRMDGNVGIGTTNPTQKLSVNGTIQAKEIVVNTGWSDFVFDNNYKLRPLTEVEQFVKTNKHLPEIPSQKEVEKNGVPLGDISSKLLMKIEELTLYMIEMKKEIQTLQKENTALKIIITKPYKK